MLNSLSIKNYRPFRSFKLENIARVNLIVGANNSGKSSLLEAVSLLASEDVISSLIYILNERGEFALEPTDYRLAGRPLSSSYQTSHIFHGYSLQNTPVVEIRSEAKRGPSLKIFVNKKGEQPRLPLDEKEPNEEDRTSLIVFEHRRDGRDAQESLRITPDGLLLDRSYRPLSSRRVVTTSQSAKLVTTNYLAYDTLAILWDDITLTPKEDKVVEALQILDPRVERISFTSRQTSNSGVLLKLSGEREPVPLGSMGDGMRRILAITASLVSIGSGTLLVDEIDTGLYHGALTDMWRLIFETSSRQDAQVFATTHSWDCVRAFQQALGSINDPDLGRLFRLEKQDDQIKAVGYSFSDLDIAVTQGIEVR